MKALELLQYFKDGMEVGYPPKHIIENAIKEVEDLEKLQNNINVVTEEIEYALAKPMYADVYLNNALRFLKERI